MAKGNCIVVSADPKGQFMEGIINDTSVPGTVMQILAATAPVGGRFTWKAAAPGTDGLQCLNAVLREDDLQGAINTTAYVAGTRCFMYCPIPGEDVNILLGEVAGTGNTYAIGDRLIIDADSGIFVPESGSPQATPFICLETVTQVSGSHLTWCKFQG